MKRALAYALLGLICGLLIGVAIRAAAGPQFHEYEIDLGSVRIVVVETSLIGLPALALAIFGYFIGRRL